MKKTNLYEKLAGHLSLLGMGYPPTEDLLDILRENFGALEAEVALAIPSKVIPLEPVSVEEISSRVDLSRPELKKILEGLSEKGLLFEGPTKSGEVGYALQQVGFSFPQTFFWKGEDSPHARHMANLIAKYFNRKVTREAYSSRTNPYRYVPLSGALEAGMQSVYPHHLMKKVIEGADDFAVCHCSCRMIARLRGNPCEHETEVCLKFDEIARYVIDKNLGRRVTREEARKIIGQTEAAGLVHFVDNALGDIKHNCNCCGCACWNVGSIKRRKIPRDILMATYFIRETDMDVCSGCGECADVCPVDAVKMEEDRPVLDRDWCIGCGVCVTRCSNGAAKVSLRSDRTGELPAKDFRELHEVILREKGLA